MRRLAPLLALAGLLSLALADGIKDAAAPPARNALLISIDGPIGPAISHYVSQGLTRARELGSAVVILQMDTPGGLDTAMRDIVKAILASPVPVATFVSPNGARAASAGTYILYASHVAAMAPATNLGSATPVPIGAAPQDPPANEPGKTGKDKDHEKKSDSPSASSPQPGGAMERKVINDAVGYIRSLAELRGRNADWAEKAVREGANLPASAALEQKVIDLIATDTADLLARIDGRTVGVGEKQKVTLATAGLTIVRHTPDWRTQLLAVITNPTIAYGLLLIGIYGLLFEGYNPGAVLPGVAGAICLLLALFAFQVLSVNYAGLALILLGAILVVAEAFVPSFGTLGLGGLIAFVIGSIMLFDTGVPGYSIALPVIGAIAFVAGLLLVAIVFLFNRARRRPVATGVEQMLGSAAEATSDFVEFGTVRVGGEIWNARSSVPVRAGQRVRIVKIEGLQLWVEPL